MKKSDNPNEYLDSVLRFIYEQNELKINGFKTSFTFSEFYPKLFEALMEEQVEAYRNNLATSDGENVHVHEMKEVLEKLSKDGYLRKHENPYGQWQQDSYFTTFEGRWFIHQGGYVGKLEASDAEKSRTQAYLNQTQKNARNLTLLTVLIAIGTLVAAAYYSVEIAKNFPCFWYFHRTAFWAILCVATAALSVWLIAAEIRRSKKQKE